MLKRIYILNVIIYAIQSMLQSNLPKFRGIPQHANDISLTEWLEEFQEITAHQNMGMDSKARLLVDPPCRTGKGGNHVP